MINNVSHQDASPFQKLFPGGVGGLVGQSMDSKEGTYCRGHWVLYTNNEPSKTNDALIIT